ncbi:hypothetical protein C8D72_0916 [Kushneria indalinina DSM 14324]|uniref:Uncharacterized protein n=1 Tax=Kushneria indalinina DSM 14324 TaxID=1122140 RepID=A0A3D9DZL3_9GAMM|nr:hypothetical protein C8D72_0916 [Kushneria indalinina DSM 14324]
MIDSCHDSIVIDKRLEILLEQANFVTVLDKLGYNHNKIPNLECYILGKMFLFVYLVLFIFKI